MAVVTKKCYNSNTPKFILFYFYSSTQVHMKQELMRSQPVINTAKVNVLKGRSSPTVTSETASSSASIRSESPYSDSQPITTSSSDTVSGQSPLSFQENTLTPDSGFETPPYKIAPKEIRTSPKPERKSMSGSTTREIVKKSAIQKCPPQAFKFFMEKHYDRDHGKVWKEYNERLGRLETFESQLESIPLPNEKLPFTKEEFRQRWFKIETEQLRSRRAKLKRKDFQKIKIIGKGAFGEVSLVVRKDPLTSIPQTGLNKKPSRDLFAMKTLNKNHVVQRNQSGHVMAEKDILSEANNDWIVKLFHSFQVIFVLLYIFWHPI